MDENRDRRLRRLRSCVDLTECGAFQDGAYCSRWCQGLSDGMEWLRLTLEGGAELPRVRVFAADAPEEDAAPSLERTGWDLLLYGVRGRYLRFTVDPAAGLTGWTLAFPGRSIDQGLPFALRGDETLRKLLGVYQSAYLDQNAARARFPDRLDPLAPDPLPGLERWTGAVRWLWSAPRSLRPRLIAAAPRLHRLRGTRRGLDLLVRLAAGESGRLVEQSQWARSIPDAAERAACGRLYGADVCQAALLLPEGVPGDIVAFLRDVLPDFLPAGVECALIPLTEGAPMDEYSFLDENARLTEPPPPALDEAILDGLELE